MFSFPGEGSIVYVLRSCFGRGGWGGWKRGLGITTRVSEPPSALTPWSQDLIL